MPQLTLAVPSTAAVSLTEHLLIGDGSCSQITALLGGAKPEALALPMAQEPLVAITAVLRLRRKQGNPIRTLHVLAHGSPGAFRIGDQWIGAEALKAHATELASWGVETIALWSCHVGADDGFVALLEELTGARVLSSAEWLGRDGGVEHLQLGYWQLSDLAKQEAWPEQFRLEEFDDEKTGSRQPDQLTGGSNHDWLAGGGGTPSDFPAIYADLFGERTFDNRDGGWGYDYRTSFGLPEFSG